MGLRAVIEIIAGIRPLIRLMRLLVSIGPNQRESLFQLAFVISETEIEKIKTLLRLSLVTIVQKVEEILAENHTVSAHMNAQGLSREDWLKVGQAQKDIYIGAAERAEIAALKERVDFLERRFQQETKLTTIIENIK